MVEKNYREAKVLVVCADGVATSTVVLVTLREFLEERGIHSIFHQGRVLDANRTIKGENFDFIVSTAGTSLDIDADIPIISGVPFLTGIGKEEAFEQIINIINQKYKGVN